MQRGQVATIDKLYDFTQARRLEKENRIFLLKSTNTEVGSCLKTRIHNLLSIKAGGTCGCNTLARKMDIWGPDECEARREYIVDRLMENKAMLVDALSGSSWLSTLAGWVIGSSFSDPILLRTGANWLLSEAIKESREKSPKKKEVVKHSVQKSGIAADRSALLQDQFGLSHLSNFRKTLSCCCQRYRQTLPRLLESHDQDSALQPCLACTCICQ